MLTVRICIYESVGKKIKWDVIHFNEGLHSLWPRVNTSAELASWANQLSNFTFVRAAGGG